MSEKVADIQIGLDLSELNKGLESMQSALVAIGAQKVFDFLAGQIEACMKASIEFESALAGVAKTTDLSEKELSQYANAIRDMATKIPLTTTELLGISEAAGQLGISGRKNLLNFTETMAKLGTATNMTSDQAATMLAQFANITSMPTDDYSRLGSTIVALGNSSATTESAITEMAQGMAAAATNAGISESQILAMSAATASVGIQAAAGSTSWSQLISKIQTAVETGKNLDSWASVAGMTAQQFKQAWGTDAAGAIDLFVKGLKEQDRQGVSMISTLKSLGISEVRQQRLVQSLANAEGLLTKSLNTAETAWKDDTALNKEAATRYATTESKVQLLNNRFDILRTTIGDQMKPAFNGLLDTLSDITDGITEFAEENEWLGPVLMGVTVGVMALVGAVTVATLATKLFTAEMRKLLAEMVTNPIFLVVAAITAAVVAMQTWVESVLQASDAMEGYSAQAKQMADDSKKISDSVDEVKASNETASRTMQSYIGIVEELGTKTNRSQKEQWQLEYALNQLNQICPDLELSIKDLNKGLDANAKRALAAAEAESEYQAILDKQAEIQGEIIDAEVTMKSAEEELLSQKAALTEEQLKQAEVYLYGVEAAGSLNNEWADAIAQEVMLDEQTRTYVNSLAEYEEVQKSCNEAIANGNSALEYTGTMLENVSGLTAEQKSALEGMSEAEQAKAEAVMQSGEVQIQSMMDLHQAYEDAKTSALDSLNQQIDKWHKLEEQEKISTNTIVEGYKQQAKTLKNFNSNLENLNNRNIAGLSAWIKANNDGSAEFRAAVEGMASASDSEIQEIINAWNESQGAMDKTAGSVAKLSTDYDKEAKKIADSTNAWIDNLSQEEKAYANTLGTLEQVEAAAKNMQQPISSAFDRVANAAVTKLRQKLNTTVKFSTRIDSNGNGQVHVSGHDEGGYFTRPHLAVIAERRPEFVGAPDDLEAFINNAVSKAIIQPNEAFNRRMVGNNLSPNNTKIEVNMPIQVSRQMTDADITRKADMITNIVSKKFAEATGGSLS